MIWRWTRVGEWPKRGLKSGRSPDASQAAQSPRSPNRTPPCSKRRRPRTRPHCATSVRPSAGSRHQLRRREPAHGRTDVAQCGLVRGLRRFEHGGVRLGERGGDAACVASGDQPDFNPHFGPLANSVSISRSRSIIPRSTAPETRHDGGRAIDHSAFFVDAREAHDILTGKQQMLMAQEQNIDSVKTREGSWPAFSSPQHGSEAGRSPSDRAPTTRSARSRTFAKLGAHGLDDIKRGQAPRYMGLVPLSNLRRRDADPRPATQPSPRQFRTCRQIRARSRSKAETRARRPCCERCMKTTGKRACSSRLARGHRARN